MDFDVHGHLPQMPYNPSYTRPSIQDLTVRHGYLLMKAYYPKAQFVVRPQTWLEDPADLLAMEELQALYLVQLRNGVFYRTYQGQQYMDKLYEL